jgi:phospholipid transport system substrate-binding protein
MGSVGRRWLVAAMVAVTFVGGGAAWAGAPTDQLRGRIDRVLKVMEGELKQDGRSEERRVAIRKIADETFDFREISQRSLARHWQSRTAVERDEFVQLFTDLLERSYIGQIEQYSGSEKVQYVGETLDGHQAVVRTRIVTKAGTEVPVDYRLHRVGEQWLVYDVAIEGISLVSNYRAQFDRIIRSSSYKQLADKLKAKKDEAREADGAVMKRASTQK